jgi:flap endonuclease-1
MGIGNFTSLIEKGLLVNPAIKSTIPISTLYGKKIAVDALTLARAYRSTACNNALDKHNIQDCALPTSLVTEIWVDRFIDFILSMYEANILPLFIFDGKPPEDKVVLKKRKTIWVEKEEKMNIITYKLEELWLEKEREPLTKIPMDLLIEYKKQMRNNSYSSYSEIDALKQILRICGIPVIQAPSEAEQLCCSLAIDGHVAAVMSNDADCYIYGAPLLLTEYSGWGKYATFTAVRIDLLRVALDLTPVQMVEIAVLAGCDYNEGVEGVAIGTAYKWIKKFIYIENIVEKKLPDYTVLDPVRCRKHFRYMAANKLLDLDYENMKASIDGIQEGIDFLTFYKLDKHLPRIMSAINTLSVKSGNCDYGFLDRVAHYEPPVISIKNGVKILYAGRSY